MKVREQSPVKEWIGFIVDTPIPGMSRITCFECWKGEMLYADRDAAYHGFHEKNGVWYCSEHSEGECE